MIATSSPQSAKRPLITTPVVGAVLRAGENIAAGYDCTKVVQKRIDSPGRRANLLGDFTHIGIVYYSGPDCYGTYFVKY